jgi:polysaccharide biosynthesis protein PslH
MDYRPNIDAVRYFAHDILPIVRRTHPEMRFIIAGRNPARSVRRLSRLPGVVVTGVVPNIHCFLQGASVVVAPFRIAQGVQNKILEALITGVPVVSTRRPARAFRELSFELLILADTADDFAKAVCGVLERPELKQQCEAAIPNLRQQLEWKAKLAHLEELLTNLVRPAESARLLTAQI